MMFLLMLLGSLQAFEARSGDLLDSNTNAQIAASQYELQNSRDLDFYLGFLGPDLKARIDRLEKGDLVVDSGAGFGVFSTQIANQTPARSIAINTQDFWSDGTSAAKLNAASLLQKCFKGKSPEEIIQIMNQGKVERLSRLQGFSQKLIPQLKKKAAIITDLWGAYFYSANRAELVEMYYNLLAPGGKAFVMVGATNGNVNAIPYDTATDWIERNSGKSELLATLLRRYPNQLQVFAAWNWHAIDRGSVRILPGPRESFFEAAKRLVDKTKDDGIAIVLEITRTPDLQELKLPLLIKDQVIQYSENPLKFPTDVRYTFR